MTAATPTAGPSSHSVPADPKLAFRPDINGLRAIAVLAVLGFHFEVAPFGGGFVGVDIFLVISGYLMTGIILGRLERGSFSVAGFYLDRARRIVPALAVLIAAMLVVGALILLPDEYALLARQAGSSALFVSNILHWRETGYFDPGIDQKWLLHSWTLSLEWQFYLLYPLVLPLIVRFLPPVRRPQALAVAALLSLALMLALSRLAPAAGFYLLPPRAWELLAGAIIYLVPPLSGRSARIAHAAGLALIAGAVVLISPDGWPDGRALAPVAGTMLVILAARTGSRVTGNPVAAWIGLNSYSIYLWHWPIVVALRRSGHSGEWPWIALGIAAAFLLGHLSWRWVERRAWPRSAAPRIGTARVTASWRALAAYGLPALALALASFGIWRTHGLPQRFPAEVQAVARDSVSRPIAGAGPCYSTGGFPSEPCRLGPAGAPLLAILIGDSHADAELLGLVEAAGTRGAVAFNALAGCPPVLGLRPIQPGSRCGTFNARFLEPLAKPRRVPLVLTASWAGYAAGPTFRFPGEGKAPPTRASFQANLLRSTCALAAGGPTYVVLPTPRFPFWVTRELQRRLIEREHAPDVAIPYAEHEARNRAVVAVLREAERSCGVRLLDPSPYLCRSGACQGSIRHRPLYRDDHHLTDHGARLLVPMFRRVFEDHDPGPGAARMGGRRDCAGASGGPFTADANPRRRPVAALGSGQPHLPPDRRGGGPRRLRRSDRGGPVHRSPDTALPARASARGSDRDELLSLSRRSPFLDPGGRVGREPLDRPDLARRRAAAAPPALQPRHRPAPAPAPARRTPRLTERRLSASRGGTPARRHGRHSRTRDRADGPL
jgi:peptidoglycan/LPS O-acetylase OafA/YrhL